MKNRKREKGSHLARVRLSRRDDRGAPSRALLGHRKALSSRAAFWVARSWRGLGGASRGGRGGKGEGGGEGGECDLRLGLD